MSPHHSLCKILHNWWCRGILISMSQLDIHPPTSEEAAIRTQLAAALDDWLAASGKTQAAAASMLGTTQARISEIKHGKVEHFSMDLLVRLAVRAGLRPRLLLASAGAGVPDGAP